MLKHRELLRTREFWESLIANELWNKLWWMPSWLADKLAKITVTDYFMEKIKETELISQHPQ